MFLKNNTVIVYNHPLCIKKCVILITVGTVVEKKTLFKNNNSFDMPKLFTHSTYIFTVVGSVINIHISKVSIIFRLFDLVLKFVAQR